MTKQQLNLAEDIVLKTRPKVEPRSARRTAAAWLRPVVLDENPIVERTVLNPSYAERPAAEPRTIEIIYKEAPQTERRVIEISYKKKTGDRESKTVYTTAEEAAADPNNHARLIAEAVRTLMAWRKRFAALEELHHLMSNIDERVETLAAELSAIEPSRVDH